MRLPHAIGSLLCLLTTACISLPDIEASPPESPSGDAGPLDAGYDGGTTPLDGGIDQTPPTIVRTVPLNYATRVPLDSSVEIDFSEEMNPGSLRLSSNPPTSFSLSSWIPETRRAVFRASTPFAQDTQYAVTVEGRDLAENSLPGATSLTFTTLGPAPDTTPPALLESSPPDGANGVPRAGTIKLTFSEPMNSSSVENAFSITSPAIGSAGTFNWNPEGTEALFTPNTEFPYATIVNWSLAAGAADLAGNTMPDISRSFHIIQSGTITLSANSYGEGGLIYDTDTVSHVSPWPIGDDSSNKAYRAGISFYLSLNNQLTRITSASLMWPSSYDSCGGASNPSPFMTLGALVAELISYGNSFDPQTVWYAPRIGTPVLIDSASALNGGSGFCRIPVSEMVADTWANRSSRSMRAQFRLRFDSITNSDNKANQLKIEESGVKLLVTYEYP